MISYTCSSCSVFFLLVKLHGLRTHGLADAQASGLRTEVVPRLEGWNCLGNMLIGLELWCEIQDIAIVRQHAAMLIIIFQFYTQTDTTTNILDSGQAWWRMQIQIAWLGWKHPAMTIWVINQQAAAGHPSLPTPPNVLLVEYFQVYPSLACARWAPTRYKWS